VSSLKAALRLLLLRPLLRLLHLPPPRLLLLRLRLLLPLRAYLRRSQCSLRRQTVGIWLVWTARKGAVRTPCRPRKVSISSLTTRL
jgi:hypothetical protein